MHGLTVKVILAAATAATACICANLAGTDSIPAELDQFSTESLLGISLPGAKPLGSEARGRAFLDEAERQQSNGNLDQALQSLSRVLELPVDQQLVWEARRARARIYEQQKKYCQAEHELTRFIRTSPPGILLCVAFSHRADLYESTDRADLAELDRERIAALR